MSWSVQAGTSGADAIAEANVAGAAATSGVLPVSGDTFDAFASDVSGGVDFCVVADVAGALGEVKSTIYRLEKGKQPSFISELSEALDIPPRPVEVNSDIVVSLWLTVNNLLSS